MKISPGAWLLLVSAIYTITSIVNIWVYPFMRQELTEFAYCVILTLPLWIPPIARFCSMRVIWRR